LFHWQLRRRNVHFWPNGPLRPLQKSTAGVHPKFAALRNSLPAHNRDQQLDAMLGFHTVKDANDPANLVPQGRAPAFGPFAPGAPPMTRETLLSMDEATLVCLRLFYADDFGIVDNDTQQQRLLKFAQWLQ
jgi:hypothetical protein